jgi:hypothetical protein
VKLLIEDVIHIGPVVSLALVMITFGASIAASLTGDRRDPVGGAAHPDLAT